jgi:phosphoglycerate dehydrogenase-like enzyme
VWLTYAVQVTGAFDGELVSLLPESLKYICHNGAGYDNIDVDACTQRGRRPVEFLPSQHAEEFRDRNIKYADRRG